LEIAIQHQERTHPKTLLVLEFIADSRKNSGKICTHQTQQKNAFYPNFYLIACGDTDIKS